MSFFNNTQAQESLLADDRAPVVGITAGSGEAKDSSSASASQKTEKTCCTKVSQCCVGFFEAMTKGDMTDDQLIMVAGMP